MRFPFLEKRDGSIYFKSEGKLEIYLPKDSFDDGIVIEHGMKISTLGIFIMKYYKTMDSKPETYQMTLPENIFFTYTESFETKEVLVKGQAEMKYMVYVLYNEDKFVDNTEVPVNFKNTQKLFDLHTKNKLPDNFEYHDILNLYLENMLTNDCVLGTPSVIIEVMIAELARNKHDIQVPFRKITGKDNANKISELDYVGVSMKTLAMINSTFTSVVSENIKSSITSSVAKTRTGGNETETPLEKTIKY
jgi:hypothetical protein